MPGREDFAIVKSRLLTDPRAHAAAQAYVEAGIAHERTALATVIGHVAMLGLWALRETDNGAIPGDGVVTICVATHTDPSVAKVIRDALVACGLVKSRSKVAGYFLAGFKACYGPVISTRRRNRKNAKALRDRSRGDDVSGDVSGDVIGQVSGRVSNQQNRTEQNGSEPNQTVLSDDASRASGGTGGGSLHKGQRLTPTAWMAVDVILDGLCRGEQGETEQQRALQFRRLRKAGALGDDIGADFLDRWKSKYAASIGKAKLGARRNGRTG